MHPRAYFDGNPYSSDKFGRRGGSATVPTKKDDSKPFKPSSPGKMVRIFNFCQKALDNQSSLSLLQCPSENIYQFFFNPPPKKKIIYLVPHPGSKIKRIYKCLSLLLVINIFDVPGISLLLEVIIFSLLV